MGRTFNIRSLLLIYFNNECLSSDKLLTVIGYKQTSQVLQMLECMVGEKVDIKNINFIAEYCKPELLRQHSWLKKIKFYSAETCWLETLIDSYGEWHEVNLLPEKHHSVVECLKDPQKKLILLLDDHFHGFLKHEHFFKN